MLFISSLLFTALLPFPVLASNEVENFDQFFDLSLEDLLSLEVTSVSKKRQNLDEAASAIFVITQEDIRRSGVTSIPEALRLAPGIQVARMDVNKWAITSRGFNHQFANKLLVMIDGRSVYSPSFSGVYWDVQDTILEDIERIEVIRGPGATIWGANAMNGVINIITKSAADTQGTLISAGNGNEESFVNLRHGLALTEHSKARVFAKFNERDSSWLTSREGQGEDSWHSVRSGFRVDSDLSANDKWVLQGDYYDVDNTQTSSLWVDPYVAENALYAPDYRMQNVRDEVRSKGWNVLTRWDHFITSSSNMSLQIYFDRAGHDEAMIEMNIDTLDVDFRHQLSFSENQEIIWGLGYRKTDSRYTNTFYGSLLPADQRVAMYNIFFQDEISLAESIKLTLGSKFEQHEKSGDNIQPNIRLLWNISPQKMFWSSISRAVRTPSAVEYGSRFVANIIPAMPPYIPAPVIQYSLGNTDLTTEKLLAYEMGYRWQPRPGLSIDIAVFYNDYDDIQTFQKNSPSPLSDIIYSNGLQADSKGFEISVDWRVKEWWKLLGHYSTVDISVKKKAPDDQVDFTQNVYDESAPRHLMTLRSMMDLAHQTSVDLWLYYSSELNSTSFSAPERIPAYTSLNARIAWLPRPNLQLSLIGRNLNRQHHGEFIGEHFLPASEVERSLYAQLRLDF